MCEKFTSHLRLRDSRYSLDYSRVYSPALQYFPSHFFSSFIMQPTAFFFFHVVAGNPSRGLLTRIEDRSPFGATTWEKRRAEVPLVFHIDAAARASSGHFFAKSIGKLRYYRRMQLTNYINGDPRWETCHRQSQGFLTIYDVVIYRYIVSRTYWEIIVLFLHLII